MKRIATLMVLAAAAAATAMAAAPAAEQQAPKTAGWRNDATGVFPEATPPLKWSATENIIYRRPLPDWGNATPAVMGDRMFFCADAARRICIASVGNRRAE